MEEQKKSAAQVEKDGANVTGGAEAENKKSGTTPAEGGEEYLPEGENKKENMTGYNELPEQSKVGGEE